MSSEPAGLTCSSGTCSGDFFEGTEVRLSASPTTGSFLGWTEACRGQGECMVKMDRDQVMGALFGTPGEALWAKQIGSKATDYWNREAFGKAIAMDSDNNLIAVGSFLETIMLDAEPLTSNGSYDIYVSKLTSSTGSVIWAKRFGGTSDEEAFGAAVDGSNNIYILGTFVGSVDFGGGSMTANTPAYFVLKLDANGNFLWARKIGEESYAGAAITANGDTVVVTIPFAWITVDTTMLTSKGSSDVLVLAMSASTGATIWFRSLGGTSSDSASGIGLDNSGNVVLTGTFGGVFEVGLSTPNDQILNGFLLKLAGANGAYLLSKQLGSPKFAEGIAITVDSENNMLVTGDFKEAAATGCINNLAAPQADVSDILLVKYSQAGSCIWAKGFHGTAATSLDGHPTSIAVNNSGEISIAGNFSGSTSFGGEALLSASANSPDVFSARFAGDGMYLNSLRAGGTDDDHSNGIAHSSDGRLFMTGDFRGLAEFGGIAFTSNGLHDSFIVSFAPL